MIAYFAVAAASLRQDAGYVQDLKELIEDLRQNAAYAQQDKLDLKALEQAYEPRFREAKSKTEILRVVEAFMGELHDFHASLGANDDHSPRLVPTGADIFAKWKGSAAVVEQVRIGSVAEKAGVRVGDHIVEIGGKPVTQACHDWLGVRKSDPRAMGWALNSALAGRWDEPRRISVMRNGQRVALEMKQADQKNYSEALTARIEKDGTLYLRPENSLGSDKLIAAFDNHRKDIVKAKKVILDLRNTPSGGDSTVARAILGHFVRRRKAFQHHIADEPDTKTVHDWVEYANPRFSKPSHAKVVVLVDRWTGSMGEGIAIGFDATGTGKVIGTQMAGLRGAISSFELPVSKLRVFFPTERLFHVNGTPRELWQPPIQVRPGGKGDPWLDAARRYFASGR